MSLNRSLISVALALCCSVVLYARVQTTFDRVRVTVVRTERVSSQGSVVASLPDLTRLSGQPIAIVFRLNNNSTLVRIVQLNLRDSEVTRVSLRPNQSERIDVNLRADHRLNEGDTIEFASDDDGWSVEYVELANVHGFSSGLFSFVIVPPFANPSDTVPAWLAAVLLLCLLLPPANWLCLPAHKATRWVHTSLTVAILVFFVVVLLAPVVSRYKLLLEVHTFFVCVAILYLPVLERGARSFLRGSVADPPLSTSEVRQLFPYLLCAATAAVFLVSVAQFHDAEHGFTSLINFGDQFHDSALPKVRAIPHHILKDSAGYDGQFYAQLAVDPLLRDPDIEIALENVQYRGRRILFSWTAFLFGLGQPALILQAYAVQNIVFWLLLGIVLFRWFPPDSVRNSALWSACMFSHGLVVCVRSALPDGPSMLFHVAAIIAIEGNRLWIAAGLVGVSGLAKDINLLAAPVLARGGSRWRDIRVATCIRLAALLAIPLLTWISYLALMGHDLSRVAGHSNFAFPLSGYFDKWQLTIAELVQDGWRSGARFNLLTLLSLGTQAIVLITQADWRSPWWRVGISFVLLMVVLGPNVWDGYPGASTRILLPMTFAFNVLLPRNRWFWPLFLLGNLTAILGFNVILASDVIERYLLG